jgi:hypothetical protein
MAKVTESAKVTENTHIILRRNIVTKEEWMDLRTIAFLPNDSLKIAKRHDKRNPGWAIDNPISRLITVDIVEKETIMTYPN